MKIPIKFKTTTPSLFIALGLALVCFGLVPNAQATDTGGALPNGNNADGVGVLTSLTGNAAWNSGFGYQALNHTTSGSTNTATGLRALFNNMEGNANTANGTMALFSNTIGFGNVAVGNQALLANTSGSRNIALGYRAGANISSGANNIAIGSSGVVNESNTVRIGSTQNRTFIAGISGGVITLGVPVIIDTAGRLATLVSSQRFKADIKPMDNASEAIFALKPVTFHYKQEFDPKGIAQFGLVAEEVAKVAPDLVVPDAEGKPYTVRYEVVNAMLLNEFLKQHRTMQEQAATIADLKSTVAKQEAVIAQQQKGMEAVTARLDQQAAQIQKVSAQIEVGKPAPQTVLNNR
jgi:uncharacterized coiled-coil protein SlyX